jgi:AcrR family transcriptional regulator
MKENDLDTRERIMKYTLELIQNEKDFSKITVRKIIQNAGVSLSAVNYHFGSKEKLINEVIKKPIQQYLASQENPYEQYRDDPAKILKEAVKLPAGYLAENPNISRVSILSDMTNPIENDLAVQTMQYWRPAAKAAFPEKCEEEIWMILWEIASTIQAAFLRSNNFKARTGVDYFNKEERDRFLDKYIDILLKANKEENKNGQ